MLYTTQIDHPEAHGSIWRVVTYLLRVEITTLLFKDFAHSPSKVKATTQATKEQFPNFKLIACLELHTFSSLNPAFLIQYRNSLEKADLPIVFYDLETLIIKNREPIQPQKIVFAMAHAKLRVFSNSQLFKEFILAEDYDQSVLLMMSSGNYGGMNWEELIAKLSNF